MADAYVKQGAARRHIGEWEEADTAYQRASSALCDLRVAGTSWSGFLEGMAILRMDQRQRTEAHDLASAAVEVCRKPSSSRLGQALTVEAWVTRVFDPEAAEPIAREALGLLSSSHPFYLCAESVLLASLLYSGKGELSEICDRLATFQGIPGQYNTLKYRWLKALYKMRGGSYKCAEIRQTMGEVIVGLAELYPGEAAICAMDLAEYLIRYKRYDAARELAGDLVPVFQSLRINEEAHAALMLYKQAAETEWRLGEDLARGIRSELRQIPFRPPIYYQR